MRPTSPVSSFTNAYDKTSVGLAAYRFGAVSHDSDARSLFRVYLGDPILLSRFGASPTQC